MKKVFSFLFFSLLVANSLTAQYRKFNAIDLLQNNFQHFRNIEDTLIPISFIDTSAGGKGCDGVVYTVDINAPIDSGYVSGTNVYADLEKGQRFYISDFGYDSVTINKVIAHFGIIKPSDSSGFVFAKIYNLNSAGAPDSLLGTSDSLNVSDLVFIINGTAEFNFATPIAVSYSFFISIDFGNCLQDTLALVHTEENCFDTTGGSWEKWNDLTWHSFNNSWQFETDLAIFPVVIDAITLTTSVIKNENQIAIYPNPATNFINIRSIKPITDISVYDLYGRKIFFQKANENISFQLSISSIPNGIYTIWISGNEFERIEKVLLLR